MELYLLRHGVAGDPDRTRYPDDARRPLTEDGVRKMFTGAAGMRVLDLGLETILSSPYTRTAQTAEIVAGALGLQKRLRFFDALGADCDPSALLPELKLLERRFGSVLLVGHEPFLGDLAGKLLCGKPLPFLAMKKGGLCALRVGWKDENPRAVLQFHLKPSILRALAS